MGFTGWKTGRITPQHHVASKTPATSPTPPTTAGRRWACLQRVWKSASSLSLMMVCMLFLQGCLGKLKNWFASNFLSTGAGVVTMFIIQVQNIWRCFLSSAEFNTEINTGTRQQTGVATLKKRQDFNKVGEEMYNFQLKMSGWMQSFKISLISNFLLHHHVWGHDTWPLTARIGNVEWAG